MYKLSPSILAANFSRLGQEVKELEKAGADYVHIDVMDGSFVPQISIGPPVISALRKETGLLFDVHLMVTDPIRTIEDYAKAGADIITVHEEACVHLDRTIDFIRSYGKKAAVALNPATSLHVLDEILPKLDMVLIMSVNPGFGGQKMIPYTLDKVRRLQSRIKEQSLPVDIEIDGGVDFCNIKKVLDTGVNVIVAGTSIFKGDIKKNVEAMKEEFSNAPNGNENRKAH